MSELPNTANRPPVLDIAELAASTLEFGLNNCDREPIHLSGAIQPHGMLLAVREADLIVERVSANAVEFLGRTPADLLGTPLVETFDVGAVERLTTALGDPRASGSAPLLLQHRGSTFDLTWQRVHGLIVLELEPADFGNGGAMSVLFADVRYAMEAMLAADSVQALCEAAATELKHVTGYDRVMVYQFHPDGHGEVVAESCEPGLEPFLNLHYPASDIPRQARKMYLLNHLRVITDIDYEPVPLLHRLPADDPGLNLSLSSLRSVSPIHLKYLRNMGVQATLTISLMRGNGLWGMLACHHSTAKRTDARLRAACRVLGQIFSQQVVIQEDAERIVHRDRLQKLGSRLVSQMSDSESLSAALMSGVLSPLDLTAADGMAARIEGETAFLGRVPPTEAVQLLLTRLCLDDEPAALVCDDVPHRFPEMEPYKQVAAGVLAIPLSAGYEDFFLWFRGERVRNVRWAGNPDKPMEGNPESAEPSTANLGPRTSFAAWVQQVRGRSSPWQPAEADAAHLLASAVPDLLLIRARDRLAHLAMHDPLTGLSNRSLLLERTAVAIAGQSSGTAGVALLFIDLDRFKSVNDSLGHAAGDSLLCQAAQRFVECVRVNDTVARIGGDEFAVLSTDISSVQATQLAERIVHSFRQPFLLGDHQAFVTASIGIAMANADSTANELLRDSDTAMYRAKRTGRDAAAAFDDDLREISLRRVEIETKLRSAIADHDLCVYYQPLHSSAGLIVGFEALARWPLVGRGMVAPDEFIPVAESMGLIVALTEWVLETGLADLVGWRCEFPELRLGLSVNISASQLGDDLLEKQIAELLHRYNVPPQALCLEITETALVTEGVVAHQCLRRLRALGVRLSIDDFGTGYSALAYLTKLPVHEVKIDRAFVTGLPANHANVTVIASVVALAHQLGLTALAEGVETEDELATVRRLGCDLIQGYLLGRPMPAEEVNRFLTTSYVMPLGLLAG